MARTDFTLSPGYGPARKRIVRKVLEMTRGAKWTATDWTGFDVHHTLMGGRVVYSISAPLTREQVDELAKEARP